jgi:hypothetical protein
VSHRRLRLAFLIGCAAAALTASGTSGALVAYQNLILHANGGFTPRTLPRSHYAPIEFKGHFDIDAKDGGRPLALQRVVLDFDRDGRLTTAGLPTCAAEQVAAASVEEARRVCAGAIVGRGHVEALVTFGGVTTATRSELTVFNAPPVEGHPAVILHAQFTTPATQTFAIVAPITRRRGEYRYRVAIEVPPIATGLGSLTHLDAEIGRRYKAGGQRRSYVSARCSDGILRTQGAFTFSDGTLIEGNVEKFCRAE